MAELAAATRYRAGFSRLMVRDDDGARATIRTALWYPTEARERDVGDGGVVLQVARDALPAPGPRPLVLLSHGSGGWYGAHHDIAEGLARRGYVVAAPTHPGDNVDDLSGYGGEGQLLGRPRHLARVYSALLGTQKYAAIVDPDQVAAIGYSAGAYAVLIAMGADADFRRFAIHFAAHPDAHGFLPHWESAVARLPAVPPWTRVPAIRAAVLLAPALGFLFTAEGLTDVRAPLRIVVAERDVVAPPLDNAVVLRDALPGAVEWESVPGFGHYGFVAPANDTATRESPETFTDRPGLDRRAMHHALIDRVAGFLARHLGAGPTRPEGLATRLGSAPEAE